MLTLPFFATHASIVVLSAAVAAHASVAPPAPRTRMQAAASSFFFMCRTFRWLTGTAKRLPRPFQSPRFDPRTETHGFPPIGRKGVRGGVGRVVPVRAPHLYRSLRCFCLGTFSLLHHEMEHGGAELPFAFEEHASPG